MKKFKIIALCLISFAAGWYVRYANEPRHLREYQDITKVEATYEKVLADDKKLCDIINEQSSEIHRLDPSQTGQHCSLPQASTSTYFP